MEMIGAVLSRLLISMKMLWVKYILWRPLIKQTFQPQRAQEALLLRILRCNQHTDFGQKYHFATINSYHDFQQTLPVHGYEDLRGLIEQQENSKLPCLHAGQAVMYAQTSGTTGKPKYIPILPETITQYRHSQHCAAYAIHKAIPNAYAGKVLAIVSPAVEGYRSTGTSYGSMSGLIYRSMPDFVSANYVVPMSVLELNDYELKYRLITAFALAEKNITLMATANPSTLLKIADIINAEWDTLIREVATGNAHGLGANPERAEVLKMLGDKKGMIMFADIWPNLQAVTTWTGGNCAVLIPALRKQLHPTIRIVEMGYLSSEFRGSLTIDADRNKSIPTIHENFFEFVDRDCWEDETRIFQTISTLQEGKQYYVFVTTQNGLYRYFINDIVEVDGWYNNTPTIRFVQKGKGVINLTGEKLYESQVIEAVKQMGQALKLDIGFFIMFGDTDLLQYTLYIAAEPCADVATMLEKYLAEQNIEFAAKRRSGRLQQTVVCFVSSMVFDAYKKFCIDHGQRESQFKLIKLQNTRDCAFDFEHYRINTNAA